ncbi:MAG: hypothetical protein KAY32_15850 [Candidatus Eisenbacteria sp.]|nr:hypothetical protein [Candidatus Eisenbacteria bacterium]
MSGTERSIRWALVVAGGVVLSLAAAIGPVSAIHPLDHLSRGQDLVEQATREIDRRQALMLQVTGDREALYRRMRQLSVWEQAFAEDSIGMRYRLESAPGLMIRDGIADTVATRLHDVLAAFVAGHSTEILDRSRQAFEIATSRFPMPPGRFLGFHFVELAALYGAQADTAVAVIDRGETAWDSAGVMDGYLRRLWNLSQLYQQTHRTPAERYFCRIIQEDWMTQRMRSEKCGARGFRFVNQHIGMKDNPSEECMQILYGGEVSYENVVERLRCRHWGHVFEAVNAECADTVRFSIPLPFYRIMQIEMAEGEGELPDLDDLVRPRTPAEEASP